MSVAAAIFVSKIIIVMQNQFKTQYQTIVHAPISKVWDALTNPTLVKEYFFGSQLVTNWISGQSIIFKGEWDGTPYEDKGTVLEYVHETSLAYSYLSNWSGKEDMPENYLMITYAVKEIPEGTELSITQTNYDEDKAAHSLENWASVMDGMKTMLANQK